MVHHAAQVQPDLAATHGFEQLLGSQVASAAFLPLVVQLRVGSHGVDAEILARMAIERVDQLLVAEHFQLVKPMLRHEDGVLHPGGLIGSPVFQQGQVRLHQAVLQGSLGVDVGCGTTQTYFLKARNGGEPGFGNLPQCLAATLPSCQPIQPSEVSS